jgi:hypothetical protein
MPVRRSSRFIKSFAWSGSMFSRLRDQYPPGQHHRHRQIETAAPFPTSAYLSAQADQLREARGNVPQHERDQPGGEPHWASADGHRCYPAIAVAPDHEFPRFTGGAPFAPMQPSNRPDLGEAGPQGDPGDEEDDDDESWIDDLFDDTLLLEDFDVHSFLADEQFVEDLLHDVTKADLTKADLAKAGLAKADLTKEHITDNDLVDNDWLDDEAFENGLVIEEWADAPFSPASGIIPWPIDTPDDAIDTFELHRSPTLQSGLVILALDHQRVPFLQVSLRGNPVDDIQRALSLFCPALPNGRIPGGLILGVIRSQHREAPQSLLDSQVPFAEPSIWVDPVESAAWRVAAWDLHDEGIGLHDVIVIEPDRWMSLARAAGLVTYGTVENA